MADQHETRCMNFETFKKLDFGNSKEKSKGSLEYSTDLSEAVYTLPFNNELSEEISIFPDYSEVPSIDNLPLDREGKSFKKKKASQVEMKKE